VCLFDVHYIILFSVLIYLIQLAYYMKSTSLRYIIRLYYGIYVLQYI